MTQLNRRTAVSHREAAIAFAGGGMSGRHFRLLSRSEKASEPSRNGTKTPDLPTGLFNGP